MTDRAADFDRADFKVRSPGPVPSEKLDRIVEALSRSRAFLVPAARERLAEMFDRDSLLCLAFLLAIWGGLQFTPIGWVADLLALGAGLYTMAEDAAELVKAGIQAADAETEPELEDAARATARALTDNAIDWLLALAANQAFKALRRAVRAVRSKLLGRRFSAGGEKPLRLPERAVQLERAGSYLGKKKKQLEAGETAAIVVAAVSGALVIGGTAYYARRRRTP